MNAPLSQITASISPVERAKILTLADYSTLESIADIWPLAAKQFGSTLALKDPYAKSAISLTYTELSIEIQRFATGLQALRVQAGDRISLIADNSARWFIADQGIMTAGAANAVRSSQADREELLFILANSGSTGLIVENVATWEKLAVGIQDLPIQFIILLSDEVTPIHSNPTIYNFEQFLQLTNGRSLQPVTRSRHHLATLIYTSGTTGKPKGVMLNHGNLLHQVTNFGVVLQPTPGSTILSILPTWHSYERSCEYYLLSQGCTQVYTNLRSVKKDLQTWKPDYMVAVPRLWESIYEGVQKQLRDQPLKKQKLVFGLLGLSQRYVQARRVIQGMSLQCLKPTIFQRITALGQFLLLAPIHALADRIAYGKIREATGGRLKQVISGGGSLALHYDTFFEIIGINILVGYGLTETSPVLTARRIWRNLRGSAGQPIPGTEIRVVDLETRQTLSTGQQGLVLARGPQIMQGYYQNPDATRKAIDEAGWFDTGDLGWMTPQGDLILTGRAKDTIVLTNGENIEPQPIEDACLRSPYIDQIMLVGQDQRSLGALIVPNSEALEKWMDQQSLVPADLNSRIVHDLFRKELIKEVQNRPGYRPDDRIGPFYLLMEPFSIENGTLTQTLKIRRPVVAQRYGDLIQEMFKM